MGENRDQRCGDLNPSDLNRPLNEVNTDKKLQYRNENNNRPSNVISFMSVVTSTSGHLHCEFVRLLFLQDHLFFVTSGVHLPQTVLT